MGVMDYRTSSHSALDKLVGVGVGYAERKKGSHIKFFHFNDHTVISQETQH